MLSAYLDIEVELYTTEGVSIELEASPDWGWVM